MTRDQWIQRKLQRLFERSERVVFADDAKLVIFSDLHMGNGSKGDDFLGNGALFTRILEQHYLPGGWHLVLNGDIEELQRFSRASVVKAWPDVYRVFAAFAEKTRFWRIYGNHDFIGEELLPRYGEREIDPLEERRSALRLVYRDREFFVLHGHQGSDIHERFNFLVRFVLRYLARPLRIRNYEVAYNSRKRYRIERRIYEHARTHGMASVIGHTHRPLFETLSKFDSLRFRIERLCRRYQAARIEQRPVLEGKIRLANSELLRAIEQGAPDEGLRSLYNIGEIVPCLFNSGSGIGKSGITALEIADGRLSLVLWIDRDREPEHIGFSKRKKKKYQLPGTDTWRITMKSDDLEYVFARIRLLS